MNKAAERSGTSLDDATLIRQYRDGSLDAFNDLYRRHVRAVHGRVQYMVPAEDAEDVTQEVFVSAARSLSSFRGDAKLSTWLRSLTNHKIAEYYRKRGRSAERLAVSMHELASRSDDSNTSRAEDRLLIQQGLRSLPADYRDVILMRFSEDLSFGEISQVTGKNLEAVKSLFRRAMSALRTQMDRE
jgi:RNA polymerase sigma-70 factor (ECF subfamily)